MNKLINKLKHYFFPHKGNEYRAHIFRETSLGILFAIVLISFVLGTAHKYALTNSNYLAAVYSGVLIDLANEDRKDNALGQLAISAVLEEAARMKAEDMAAKGYFSHYGPDGSAPWDWMKKAGYNFVYAGENLAIDFTDSKEVDRAWMNSPTHRANILNSKFSEIGIATVKGEYNGRDTIYVVQMFGTPLATNFTLPVSTTPIPINQLAQNTPIESNPQVEGAATETPKSTPTPTPKPTQVIVKSPPQKIAKATPLPTKVSTVSTSSVEKDNYKESFISVESMATATIPAQIKNTDFKENFLPINLVKDIGTNPSRTIEIIYAFIGLLLMIGLLGMVGRSLEKHHLQHALGGATLMVVIVTLGYIYKASVFSGAVIIAINSL